MVLEKLERPDSDIPHMLHLGEEFDRAVGVSVAPLASSEARSHSRSTEMHPCCR